jgi:uncharacterized 2Fe-2S/4Fe-4S cluster protein (DUF4445 family)
MPSVQFLPASVTVEVPAGTLIHEAAIRAGLHDLELPCGGAGTCGQCLVEVSERLVMACQTHVSRDITVRVPENRDVAMQVVGDSHFLAGEDVLPERGTLTPLYRLARVAIPPASIEEHYSDWKRLARELGEDVTAPLKVLRGLAAALREEDGRVTVALEGSRVVEVEPGWPARRALAVPLDSGTTTLAAQLVDLEDGRVLSTGTLYTLQIRRGADVLTRIAYARTPERLEELRGMVLETINTLVGETGADAAEIRAAYVAGNTTMVHLLLGLEPRYIRESPYVPTVNPVPPLTAREVGIAIHPDAIVEIAPGVGSYVGGDITAGLLSTDIPANRNDVFLFLDIGTNGEIVIGNADWMVACACSAGPAFEGSGIQCGMRATAGAIEQVEIGAGGEVRYRVIGGEKPAGICGSGLISLLGEMFARGIVDRSGRLHSGRAFTVAPASETATGEDLLITVPDLENLVRTKAAIYAACARILENVGLDWEALARVYIAGGFGRYIQVADAIRIGMLPDLPHGRFTYIGNSSLTGAYIALLSRPHRERLAEIANKMTYVDLGSDPRYMDSYVKAMFLPHTDLERFPSVARIFENGRRQTL